MQVKKESIKDKILISACEEFIEHGYVKASLREIADKAGLTKGAIYSYFKNKNELFCELTAPALNFIKSEFQHDNYLCKAKNKLHGSYELTIQSFTRCAHSVLDNYKSFKLLFFCSAGSSLQDYKEIIIQIYARNFYKILSFFTQESYCKVTVNEMFIHTLATTYVSFLEEIVLHEPERDEIDKYAKQLAIFVHCGINNLYAHEIKNL